MSSIDLVTGGMPVSIDQFGYRCESCELVALGYSWVTLVQFMLTSFLGLCLFFAIEHVVKPFLL
jgi:hypothetical protein